MRNGGHVNVRALAVLGVICFHVAWIALIPNVAHGGHGATTVQGGYGLEVFFIISGFLVWRTTRQKHSPPALFLLHRITRIVPLYTFFTLLFVGYIALSPLRIGAEDTVTIKHLVLSLIFVPHISSHGATDPILNAGWTLVLDMFYFVLFAFALSLPKRIQLAAATMLYVAPLVVHFFHFQAIVAVYYTSPLCLSFLGGIWIAEAFERRILPGRAGTVGLAATSVALFIVLIVLHVQDFRLGIAIWTLASMSAVYSMVSAESAGLTWMRVPGSGWIGRSSYGIYLAQSITIPLAFSLLSGPVWFRSLAAFVVSISAGSAANHFIEIPVNRCLRRVELQTGSGTASISAEPHAASEKRSETAVPRASVT